YSTPIRQDCSTCNGGSPDCATDAGVRRRSPRAWGTHGDDPHTVRSSAMGRSATTRWPIRTPFCEDGAMTAAVAQATVFEVSTADGRTLRAYQAGDPNGETVLVHHG